MKYRYRTIKEIKGMARDALRGHYLLLIISALFMSLVFSCVRSFLLRFVNTASIPGFILFLLIELFLLCLYPVLSYGLSYIYLSVLRGRSVLPRDIFIGLKQAPTKAILIYLIPSIASFLARLPGIFASMNSTETVLLRIYLSLLPYEALSFAVDFLVALPFTYCFYLLADYCNATAGQIMKESIRMFRRRPWGLIGLYLSMLPLYFVGLFSFGIAFLWIDCYLNMGVTIMYDDLLPKKEKLVALSFDDGPNNTITPQVLDLLEQYKITASFFIIHDYVKPENKHQIKRAFDMGCSIENHSMTHGFMDKFTKEQIEEEIRVTDELIMSITGVRPSFFRPPFIVTNDLMFETIDKTFICGMGVEDWVPTVSAEERLKRIKEGVKDGTIILLHDMEWNQNTVDALKEAIPWLLSEGYRFVTVPEMFVKKGVTPDHKVMYSVVE